jgi:hypothetical protein
VVAEEDRASAVFIIDELVIYRTNEKLKAQLQKKVLQRADDKLTAHFHKVWD